MKIKPDESSDSVKIKNKPKKKDDLKPSHYAWWNANSKADLNNQIINAADFLKKQQLYRYREAALYSRLYGNMPLFNLIGSSMTAMNQQQNLPIDRPTMNVVQSCVDTLVSRVTQSKPRPVFLTDNGDSKQRTLAKQMNTFIQGEFYQTKAYAKTATMLRDASVLGTGVIKVLKNMDTKRVEIERTLPIELLVDPNDALYGEPRQLFQMRLVDRSVMQDRFPEQSAKIERAEQAFPEANGNSSQTISDQIMLIESWHLRSGKDAGDGMHAIACSNGLLFEEEYEQDRFPFVFFDYSPRLLGFWGQSLAEQLMGTQVEINKLLMTISKSINIMGVPRVFVEDGSKVSKTAFNNEIGSIITYRGTMPQFVTAECMAPEIYAQLQRLVEYAYQQSGISGLAAAAAKPAGLNSGEAIRNYDDLQSDRFASLVRRFDDAHIDLGYLLIDTATEIAEEEGKYETIFPGKNGVEKVDLPATKELEDNPYVLQCFDTSSLPRDPAGRKEYVTEMMQAGILSQREGRRLLQFPDLEQEDKLANAAEERILKILDDIVDNGKYTPPDPYMDLQLAQQMVVQYYNLYEPAKLSEARCQMLRDFDTQLKDMVMAATPPPPPQMPQGPQGSPQAVPQAPPVSPMLPQNS